MTSSARDSTDGGIVRPSAFAALRLTVSSNLKGCSTGSWAGLAPLRILSTKTVGHVSDLEREQLQSPLPGGGLGALPIEDAALIPDHPHGCHIRDDRREQLESLPSRL